MTPNAAPLPARLRAGEEDALRTLFRSLAPQAHALAQRVAGPHAADAVVEEVFLLAWREPERWNAATFELELLRCVRDTALAVRRRGINAAAALAGGEPPIVAPDEAAVAVGSRDAELVRAATYALSDAQRELLEAAWFEAGRLDAIAQEHGIETNDIPATLTAALTLLADTIEARS